MTKDQLRRIAYRIKTLVSGCYLDEAVEVLADLHRPRAPRLGVAVMVTKEIAGHDCLLLGQSKKIPGPDNWVVPGGGVKFGEGLAEAGVRELFEETGLKIEIRTGAVRPWQLIEPEDHRVILFYEGRLMSGDLTEFKSGDDLEDVGFFSREQIANADPSLTPLTAEVLRQAGWL